jgi:hypothetical protein
MRVTQQANFRNADSGQEAQLLLIIYSLLLTGIVVDSSPVMVPEKTGFVISRGANVLQSWCVLIGFL